MRIAIDLTALIEYPTVVDRSLVGLVDALAGIDAANEYVLFINDEDRGRFGDPDEHGSSRTLPRNFVVRSMGRRARASRLYFQQVRLPRLLNALQVDVLHSPTFIMPAWRGRQGHVLTIHDMTSFLAPDCHPRARRGALYELAVRTSIRRASIVCVPAPAVRSDILELVPGVDEGRIEVVPHGIDDSFCPQPDDLVEETLARLSIPKPYILYVGTLDPRKNLPTLVDAYALLLERGREEQLVLAGRPGWTVASLHQRLAERGVSARVHLPGYVAEPDLRRLYAGAAVFVYPSLLEGFGFPPLEAMASGTPVVASCTSSLRDYLSGAAHLVQPEDTRGFAASMLRLLEDPAARESAVKAGFERAAQFRWDRCAHQTLGCYQRAAAQRGLAL